MRAPRFLPLVVLLAACGGAGPYGYAREYEPLGDEEEWAEREQRIPYEDVRRDPADHVSSTVGWFGVVTGVDASGDRARVAMSFRTHQARHLCEDERDSSCRVTVSDRSSGPFTAVVALRPEDQSGQDRVWQGSLLKVYGSPNGEFDDQGGPVVEAQWYRHWPRGNYVTTGAAASMRR